MKTLNKDNLIYCLPDLNFYMHFKIKINLISFGWFN